MALTAGTRLGLLVVAFAGTLPVQAQQDSAVEAAAPASAITATRPICMYPGTAVYEGRGSTKEATSFVCRPSGGESRGSP